MKKVLALTLAVLMLVSTASCAKRIDKPEETVKDVPQKDYEELTLDEKLEYMSGRERKLVSKQDDGRLAPAKVKGSDVYGYVNLKGEEVIPGKYTQAYCFNGDTAPVLDEYNDYIQIGRDGSSVLSVLNKNVFKAARHFYDSYIVSVLDVESEQKKIYLAADGTTQINASNLPVIKGAKYASKQYFMVATPFKDGKAVVMRKTNTSLIADNGDSRAKLASKGLYEPAYVINKGGNVVAALPPGLDVYDYSLNSNETITVRDMTSENQLYGLCDLDGKLILPCIYRLIEYCDNNMFLAVNSSGFFGYINSNGKTVADFKYQSAYPFSNGLAAVKENDLWGFIDLKGNYVFEPVWDEVAQLASPDYDVNVGCGAYKDGVASVRKGDYWALIDLDGNIIDATYAPASEGMSVYSSVSKDVAVFEYFNSDGTRQGNSFGLIDLNGNLVFDKKFESLGLFN